VFDTCTTSSGVGIPARAHCGVQLHEPISH
jgi:hypothetical protein